MSSVHSLPSNFHRTHGDLWGLADRCEARHFEVVMTLDSDLRSLAIKSSKGYKNKTGGNWTESRWSSRRMTWWLIIIHSHCQHIIKTASMTVLPRLKSLEFDGPRLNLNCKKLGWRAKWKTDKKAKVMAVPPSFLYEQQLLCSARMKTCRG